MAGVDSARTEEDSLSLNDWRVLAQSVFVDVLAFLVVKNLARRSRLARTGIESTLPLPWQH